MVVTEGDDGGGNNDSDSLYNYNNRGNKCVICRW